MNESSEHPSLLIVDDDPVFCEVLAKAMTKRGFDVTCTHTITSALEKVEALMPEYAIIDLKLADESGLTLVDRIKKLDP
ncbi:response regulator transcription factor, partial [Nitrosomonas nitrosa]